MQSGETRTISRDGRQIELPSLSDEPFVNWLKPAALGTFRKLYRRIDGSTLTKGTVLTINVDNLFVHPKATGQKWIVLTTTSWLGSKSLFVPLTCLAISVVLLALAMTLMAFYATSPDTYK